MWPSGLTLAMTLNIRFQCQIWNLLYLSQKLFNCHEMKNEHINWTLGLKCSQHFWHCSWPWIFKVNFKIAVLQKWQGWLTLSLIHNHDGDLWWPRWGVRFYWIVTGVTSDAGVPSTHLVLIGLISRWLKLFLKNSSDCIQLPLAQTWKKSIFLNKTFYIYSSFIQFYTYVFISQLLYSCIIYHRIHHNWCQFQTNDTICTDEEAFMAQQVAMQLTGGLNVYNNSIKNIKQKGMPYITSLQVKKQNKKTHLFTGRYSAVLL